MIQLITTKRFNTVIKLFNLSGLSGDIIIFIFDPNINLITRSNDHLILYRFFMYYICYYT